MQQAPSYYEKILVVSDIFVYVNINNCHMIKSYNVHLTDTLLL